MAERGLLLRIDCRRCGHHRLVAPWDLIRRRGPSTPWRWLRFRCNECRSADVLMRAATPRELERGPVPLYERKELIQIVPDAIHTDLAAQDTCISKERARAVADAVLRRLMAAGLRRASRRRSPRRYAPP